MAYAYTRCKSQVLQCSIGCVGLKQTSAVPLRNGRMRVKLDSSGGSLSPNMQQLHIKDDALTECVTRVPLIPPTAVVVVSQHNTVNIDSSPGYLIAGPTPEDMISGCWKLMKDMAADATGSVVVSRPPTTTPPLVRHRRRKRRNNVTAVRLKEILDFHDWNQTDIWPQLSDQAKVHLTWRP